jgi:hypothetical protein
MAERGAAELREREAASQHAEASELDAAIELSKQLHREAVVDGARRRLAARPEPAAGAGVASLRVTLPSGARVQRRFAADDTLAVVRDYVCVAAHELRQPLLFFDLGTTFPRRAFAEADAAAAALSLREAGLFPQAAVVVSQTPAQRERERAEAGGGATTT